MWPRKTDVDPRLMAVDRRSVNTHNQRKKTEREREVVSRL